ncbi:hypothetical protein F5Y17DRAFT_474234 [Xylariaceae sp. FL0594]|nr:hypothetical protein F5Y17DRAFT_474234 [Xylariaceae sp. FL0594]
MHFKTRKLWHLFVVVVALADILGLAAWTDPVSDLNLTLHGRLMQASPWAEPCYAGPNSTACAAIRTASPSLLLRTQQYQGFENFQSEACIAKPENQCPLPDLGSAGEATGSCKQGLVSPHYVAVASAADAHTVFSYARAHKIQLSVKNTGHDYAVRSSRRGSLALWTRNLRDMVFHPSFTPHGCSSLVRDADSHEEAHQAALTLGAGVDADAALVFAHEHGVVFTAPSAGSLGASGGWLLNGGHSAISNTYGLAVDRVRQFAVATADGETRIANRCTNPDLFWALRGGGGGAFGIVLNSTWIAEPEQPMISAYISFPANAQNQQPFVDIVTKGMRNSTLAGWGGIYTTNFALLNNFRTNDARANQTLAPLIQYAESQNGSSIVQTHDSYFDYYVQYINGSFASPAVANTASFVTSRLIPDDVFGQSVTREQMVDVVMQMASLGLTPFLLANTPYLYAQTNRGAGRTTSINPIWYRSLSHLVAQGFGWPSTASLARRREVVARLRNATQSLRQMAPGGGTYANEADPWLENWSEEFWGANYGRLLQIKRKYDPYNLLSCWHCVGWEEHLPDYDCISDLVA